MEILETKQQAMALVDQFRDVEIYESQVSRYGYQWGAHGILNIPKYM